MELVEDLFFKNWTESILFHVAHTFRVRLYISCYFSTCMLYYVLKENWFS
jgi:hypothetical protein